MKVYTLTIAPGQRHLFRDEVPFEQGGFARTRGPLPCPTTIYGLTRSMLLDTSLSPKEREKFLNAEEKTPPIGMAGERASSIYLIGPHLAMEKNEKLQIYYPTPSDLLELVPKQQDNEECTNPQNGKKVHLSIGEPWKRKETPVLDVKRTKSGSKTFTSFKGLQGVKVTKQMADEYPFLTQDLFKKYLLGEITASHAYTFHKDKNLLKTDKKALKTRDIGKKVIHPGINIEYPQKRVKIDEEGQGHYYRIQYYQYNKPFTVSDHSSWRFLTFLNIKKGAVEMPPSAGKVRLGGESKLATATLRKDLSKESLEKQLLQGKMLNKLVENIHETSRFKLVLTSPTVFIHTSDGLVSKPYPSRQTLQRLEESVGSPISLRSFSVKGREVISGWSYKENKVKDTYLGVSSGSTYYFEVENEVEPVKIKTFIKDLVIKDSLAFSASNYQNFLGSCLIGVW